MERHEAWISVAITYTGLEALGVPEESLKSFPEAFRVGMAARADVLHDRGENDPEYWDAPFGRGRVHIAVSIFSDTEEKWRHTMKLAREQYNGLPGVTVLHTQDFGAQPGDLNPMGYKDGIGQPAIEGSGVDPLRDRVVLSKPVSLSSAIRARLVFRSRCRGRMCSGATALSSGCESTRRGSEHSIDSCERMLKRRKNVSCWRRSWSAGGVAARH